ncbi:kinase-like domain-containing protein [Xylaria cf. heliscus]|nr:kinase-like domain-containing protein [Xylaria cf. heliscus]
MAPQAQAPVLTTWPVPAMSSSSATVPSCPPPAPSAVARSANSSSSSSSSAGSSSSSSSGFGSSAEPISDANAHPGHSFVQPTKPSPTTATNPPAPMNNSIATNTSTATTTNTTTTPTTATATATATAPTPAPVLTAVLPAATPATLTIKSAPSPSATSAPRPIPSSSKTVRSGISDLNRLILGHTIGLIIPPPEPSTSPSHSSTDTSSCCSSLQTPIDSLRRYPTDLTTPIPEECDEETCSESLPNDPVTPVSGRQSRDFRFCDSQDLYHRDPVPNSIAGTSLGIPEHPDVPLSPKSKSKEHLQPALQPASQPTPPALATQDSLTPTKSAVASSEQNPSSPATIRPIARRSSSTISRAMSSLFRRSYHHVEENGTAGAVPTMPGSKDTSYSTGTSETNLAAAGRIPGHSTSRRFSFHRSVATTRSNSPPSPASPLEMASAPKDKTNASPMPTSRDFLENNAKKQRAYTGLSLRQRVNFVGGTAKNHPPRRARSVERKKNPQHDHLTRQPWAIPPDAGTGMKARRLSLSLPDDFTVDVAELLKEYEYQSKLGRHGKHLGKGATSKVTLMVRKGYPGELYAVKEFRSKSSNESVEDYEKKIKSEYSIAKSLHHPNVIETIRLCTNHGRWNHVMEYCSEGDLFSLVSKKYLREEGRDGDRTCIFKQLCQGINYLHKNGIAHRDIKLENLLITKDSKLKITDFGVSEVFSGIHPGLREAGGQCGVAMGEVRFCKPGICGSLPYIAPEVLSKQEDYDPRALDVWSSAVVMIYLIFNANLWEKAEAGLAGPGQKTYNDLVSGWEKSDAKNAAKSDDDKESYPKVPPFEYFIKPIGLRRLLLNMLHPNPKKRITMNDVITNRWMKNVECCQLESYDDPVKYIDASKKDCMKSSNGKIFCHNHLPPLSTSHGLPPMPGKPGY